jgi:serine/threonine-protein kinase
MVTELPIRLGGRYEIGPLLGRGGMAEVHLAQDLRLGRQVAVKMLRPDLARDPTFQARFRREAQSAASLNHPSVVAVYDTGEDALRDGAVPFIVMEYVDGSTLRELQQSGRRLLPERALEITAGVLDALDYSHRRGIVHRDIKPANVMLTRAGDVKVMDFGIARALADGASTMTSTSSVIGTAQYLSPEQGRGEQVDARSDLYSAGCLLFELLTGRAPFVGDSPVSVVYQHVREEPIAPSQIDPEISPAVDAVVLKALRKDRDERYQTAAEMRDDLLRAREGRPVEAAALAATQAIGAVPALPVATLSSTSVTPAPITDDGPPHPPRTGAYAALALAVLAVLLLAAFGISRLVGDGGAGKAAVPDLKGLTVAAAEAQLKARGLALGAQTPGVSETQEAGTVIEQSAPANTSLPEGSTIDVVVATAPDKTIVPTLDGLSYTDARRAITDAGLRVGKVTSVDSADTKDVVLKSTPAAGTELERDSPVALSIASGENKVPDVVGDTAAEARDKLQRAGFEVEEETRRSSRVTAGTVMEQSPDGGRTREIDTDVTIVIAEEPPTPTPTPTTPPPTPTPTTPAPTTAAPTTPAATTSAPAPDPNPSVSPSP